MNKLQELDIILGESLEQINDAARLVRDCNNIKTDTYLRKVGDSVNSLWEIREEIYRIDPSLKPEFLSEYEIDESRCQNLSKLHNTAYELENSGSFEEAKKTYETLLEESVYGHFKRLAEAGLYRVSKES